MNQTVNKTMNKTMNRTKVHEPWAKPWIINQGLTLSTTRSSLLLDVDLYVFMHSACSPEANIGDRTDLIRVLVTPCVRGYLLLKLRPMIWNSLALALEILFSTFLLFVWERFWVTLSPKWSDSWLIPILYYWSHQFIYFSQEESEGGRFRNYLVASWVNALLPMSPCHFCWNFNLTVE